MCGSGCLKPLEVNQGKQNIMGRSRRDFIKESSVAIGASLTCLPATAREANVAGSDIIRVGLIGCGGRGSGAAVQAMAADQGVRLVAMADLFEDRLDHSLAAIKKKNLNYFV